MSVCRQVLYQTLVTENHGFQCYLFKYRAFKTVACNILRGSNQVVALVWTSAVDGT